MKFTFLGTGTSQGVPVIGCQCAVCKSPDFKDKRLRTALLVQSANTTVCIDAGPDFRYQMLRAGVLSLDAIIITHEHQDHVAGLDDVRAFNFLQKRPMKIFATERVQEVLKQKYAYIFNNQHYPGVPQIIFVSIGMDSFSIGDIDFQPIPMMHADMPVLGFRVGEFTYITDANYIGETEKNIARNSSYLVLNALRKEKHHSHFTLSEAVELSQELRAGHTFLTHISHQMGKQAEVSKELPEGVQLAWDGLAVGSRQSTN